MELVVGVGDMKVSDDRNAVLSTYSLGSCVAVCIFDPVAVVGGMLHFMLPESSLDKKKARENPYMFGDTGIPQLFLTSYRYGARKSRLKVIVAGGARVLEQNEWFNIGKRNIMMMRKLFWKNNVMIDCEALGGTVNRTLKLHMANGEAWLKQAGSGIRKL